MMSGEGLVINGNLVYHPFQLRSLVTVTDPQFNRFPKSDIVLDIRFRSFVDGIDIDTDA